MRRERNKQTFKLQLLALVLALALLWYSINPAPSPIQQHYRREDEPPDQERRELESQLQRADVLPTAFKTFEVESKDSISAMDENEDDFEWPEFIDG